MANVAPTSCWICLDDGLDDNGRPLARSCACRGDSGWAHISCLARFAKTTTDGMSADDYLDLIKKGTPWSICHTCKIEFHGDVRTTLADEWINSVANLADTEPQRIAAMLNFAHHSLSNKKDYDMAIQTYEQLRGVLSSNSHNMNHLLWVHVENICLAKLSQVYTLSGDTEKSIEYTEKYRTWCKNRNIPVMNTSEPSQTIRVVLDMYNDAVETEGRNSPNSIKMAATVANAYVDARNLKESYLWLKDAHDRAKRVFGTDHPEFIDIKKKYLLASIVHGVRHGFLDLKDVNRNGKEVTILRVTKDKKKYIVDIGAESGNSQKVKVTPSQLIFSPDTPVTIASNGSTAFVHSYNKEKNSYKLFAMSGPDASDGHTYFDVPRIGVNVLFPTASQLSSLGE